MPPCAAAKGVIYFYPFSAHGEVAQLVEHHVRNVGVESSNLFFSTIRVKTQSGFRPYLLGRAAFFVFAT